MATAASFEDDAPLIKAEAAGQGEELSLEGCNYGEVVLVGNEISMASAVSKKCILKVKVDDVALCVVPANNRDDLEIQFKEQESSKKREDSLVQMTLSFPKGEDSGGATTAEIFHKSIMDSGLVSSVTGNIIAEFTKDQGNFVTPRGKYSMQMTSTYVHMQGAQYAYKIKYDDINSLFLLPRLDGRMAFVIALDKPIRQGNQKYQNLVLETHEAEHTTLINLSEEEIAEKYDGLSQEITLPMSTLIAKIFKILSQKKVYVPKQFTTTRENHCVRCSIKANDGLLFPLAKSFIFINKPCIIIKFEDIDYVEFQRHEFNAHSATKNFDLFVYLKESAVAAAEGAAAGVKEYGFLSIDRAEFITLNDYISSRDITIVNEPSANQPTGAYEKARLHKMLELDEDSEENSDDDGDYDGNDSERSRDSNDSGSDDSAGSEGENVPKKKRKKNSEKDQRKKRAKKDKNAPKGATGAYLFFSKEERPKIQAENPSLGFAELNKEVAARWKSISDSDRERFDQLAKEDKARYEREMAEYKKSGGGAGADDGEDD